MIYVPLSIADQWRLDKIPQKSLDIVQMGRKNQILHEYALKYVSKNKHIEYIYSDYDERSKQLFYYSTIRGKINSPETRIEYMDFLRKAKVCLISSPGMDQSRPCADGIDYPTPRFYETAINYCSMIGRYDSNHDEFEMTGIPKVCCNIETFEEFQRKIDDILIYKKKIDKQAYDDFINNHLTSVWYQILLKEIKDRCKEITI